MKRPFTIVFLLVFLAGCASRKPLCPDGFFGRTAIPPPATGSARVVPDSYYAASKAHSDVKDTTSKTASSADKSGGFGDPAASWKSTTDALSALPSVSKHSESSAGDLSRNNSSHADPAVHYVSHAANSAATNRVESSETRADRPSKTVVTRWGAGRSGSSASRTRIDPPDFAHAAVAPVTNTSNSVMAARSSTSAESPCTSKTSSFANSGRQPIVRMLRPRATAAIQSKGPDYATSTTSPKSTPIAQSSWHSPTSSDRTAASAASATDTNVSRTSEPPDAGRRTIVPSKVVNIADLPDPGTRAAQRRRMDTQVRPASAFFVSQNSNSKATPSRSAIQTAGSTNREQSRGKITSTPSLRYGHAPSHAWLRGRLEYSEIAKRWKLRYIPIDGQVDQYGGSVVLRDSTLLADQQEGDFVEVHGRLLVGENDDWGYAPVYELAQLRPIGK